jgi:predicted RNase H-like HicB family nuclease
LNKAIGVGGLTFRISQVVLPLPETREEVLRLIREAIDFHIEGLRESGESVPVPHSFSELIEVASG